jgi:hypothetical protein
MNSRNTLMGFDFLYIMYFINDWLIKQVYEKYVMFRM